MAKTSSRACNDDSHRSAGGHELQPCEVYNSTTTIGRCADELLQLWAHAMPEAPHNRPIKILLRCCTMARFQYKVVRRSQTSGR